MAASAIHAKRSRHSGLATAAAASVIAFPAPRAATIPAMATSSASSAKPTDQTQACPRRVSSDSIASG